MNEIDLIPNCSESVRRIDLTEVEKEELKGNIKMILNVINEARKEDPEYVEKQTLDEYLDSKVGEWVWISELEGSILYLAKRMMKKDLYFTDLIPNCSEYVSRIDLSSDEIVRLRKVLKLMSPELCWDYFEEYLKGTDGDTIFMGEEERDAIEEALELIGKRSEKDE